jgi:hypothetical protein
LGSAAEVGAIINAPSLFAVDQLLNDAGIIEIDGITRPEEGGEDNIGSFENENSPPSIIHTLGFGLNPGDFSSGRTFANANGATFLTPAPSFSSRASPSPERPELYRELLGAVIQQAEVLSDLPKAGENILSPSERISILNTSIAVASPIPWGRESKIGAAGELFVSEIAEAMKKSLITNLRQMYELLRSLYLPGFSWENWKSTKRHLVSVHNRYQNMPEWHGRETADIVYQDQDSVLTSRLIEKGYLASNRWEGRSPCYFIEVKTTVGAWNTTFYCSQNQFDMMQSSDTDPSDKVYLIARVYQLGDTRMGLRLYLDPEKLRRNNRLRFQADKYLVTPIL